MNTIDLLIPTTPLAVFISCVAIVGIVVFVRTIFFKQKLVWGDKKQHDKEEKEFTDIAISKKELKKLENYKVHPSQPM